MKKDDLHVVHVGNSTFIASFADFTTGNPSTDIVSMENHDDVEFIIIKGAGAVGTATITVGSCDTVGPGTATAVAFEYKVITAGDTQGAWTAATSTGYLITAAADKIIRVHVKATDLYSTNKFVRLTLTETDSTACDGTVIAIMYNARQLPTPATVLS